MKDRKRQRENRRIKSREEIGYALNCNTAVIENDKSVSNLSSRTSIVIVKYKNTI